MGQRHCCGGGVRARNDLEGDTFGFQGLFH
jgi:hypothetical protein